MVSASSQPAVSRSFPDADSVGSDDIDDLLEPCLEQLALQGPVADPAMLRAMLPDRGARTFVLIELVKFDMAMAAESGQVHRIEHYMRAMPDILTAEAIPLDLLLEEIQLRKEAGETPSRDEYHQRFPQYVDMLSQLSEAAESTASAQKLGPPPEFALGSHIDDFRLIQKLGQGAFAHVYLARQESMQRLVALKLSRGKGDEPQALAQFDHPNIVRVFDQRELTNEKLHLLYMQYVPGGTLADVVKRVRATSFERIGAMLLSCIDSQLLSAAQVVPERSSVREWIAKTPWSTVVAWLGIQLARALQEAHEHGVLHRDVKPANVLLSAEGLPKLADFNVSFAGAAGRAGAAAMFGGSIGYMAPEHLRAIHAHTKVRGECVAEPADIYSLAVLLWELWQGQRPFVTSGVAISWSDCVAQQLASREQPLHEPQRDHSATERVLESTLREALCPDPATRLASGAELAGRLRLALHPQAARLFDPGESSWTTWILNRSPWLVACIVILLPNMAGGAFNYQYNLHEVIGLDRENGLKLVSRWINLTFFPLGTVIVIMFALPLVRAIGAMRSNQPVTGDDLTNTIDFGHRAALIGGSLWLIAGVLFPAIFSIMYDDFTASQAVHFFVSSMICGGVAMIYPFFGMALVSTLVYYPRFVRVAMQDEHFDDRARVIVQRSESYLLIAAIIPLLGAALLVSSASTSRGSMLLAIAAGVLGLLASWKAYHVVAQTWARMSEVLSTQKSVIPGE